MPHLVPHRFDGRLTISQAARRLAKQLAAPDGGCWFTAHPMNNHRDGWSVTDDVQGAGIHGLDVWRQLLAYGLGEITPLEPAVVEGGGVSWEPRQVYTWQIVLTERGREWADANCPLSITPPSSAPSRRQRIAGHRRIAA